MEKELNRTQLLENLAAIPHIEEAVPPTIATLRMLLASEPERADLKLALATMLLSEQQVDEAIKLFKEIIHRQDSAVARCNLGTALLLKERYTEALVELARAVLLDSSLVSAHMQLSRAQWMLDDLRAARHSLERVTAFQPNNTDALCELARLYSVQEEEGSSARATELYARAYAVDCNCEAAQLALGAALVREGTQLFHQGDVSGACLCWGEAHRRYPRVFTGDPGVQRSIRDCAEAVVRNGLLERAREEFLSAGPGADQRTYRYVQLFLLSEALLPECYEPYEALSKQQAYWEQQTSRERVFPYAHYRRGIIEGYLGNFETAASEVLLARDFLPASKHRSLRVEEVGAFFREAREAIASERPQLRDGSSTERWVAAGFEDPFSQQAWRQSGCTPQEASRWRGLGLRAQDAAEWKAQEVGPEEAEGWIAKGVTSPREVKRWMRAGVDARSAQLWQKHFPDNLSLAVQCVQAGFEQPEEALRWLEVFLFPYEAIAWRDAGFTELEARKWMKSGVKDPFLARQLRDEEEAIFEAARREQRVDQNDEDSSTDEDEGLH